MAGGGPPRRRRASEQIAGGADIEHHAAFAEGNNEVRVVHSANAMTQARNAQGIDRPPHTRRANHLAGVGRHPQTSGAGSGKERREGFRGITNLVPAD